MRWIPCAERLPEKSGRYLVTRGSNVCGGLFNKVDILNYSDLMGLKKEKIWWSGNVGKIDFEKCDHVIAWMPLPDPYKIFTENEKVCKGCHYNDGGVHAECIVCSNCKKFTIRSRQASIDELGYVFCPNCGAKMDERKTNEYSGE